MPNVQDPMTACRDLARALAAAANWQEASAIVRGASVPSMRARAAAAGGSAARRAGGAIGIWSPSLIDGKTWFVRDPDYHDSDRLWADVERIAPKGPRPRAVLLGESCARAFPFDPLFNCAAALRAYLRTATGGDDIEVVDLARCALTPGPLCEMIEAARALEPDVYILFAGNNWQIHPDQLDVDRLAATLASAGRWQTVALELARAVRTQTRAWMTAIAAACRRAGTPALFVIPAQNLRDNCLPARRYNPLLGSRDQACREDLIAQLDVARAAGDDARAERLATDLVALEDGFSVVGLQALARGALARGDRAEAVRMFEQAREMLVYLPLTALDSYATRVEEMRAVAAQEDLPIVDLSVCFREMSGGGPPGRDLFFDLVHMTARGVRVAMAATADALRPLLNQPAVSRADLLQRPVDVEPRAEAQAHAFYVQYMMPHAPDLARHHCREAVAKTREVLEVFAHYADLLMQPGPAVFSTAFSQLQRLELRFPALRGLQRRALDTHEQSTTATLSLARILTEAMTEDDPEALATFEARLRTRYAVDHRALDLLRCTAVDEALDGVPVQDRAYMKCFRREIVFVVISGTASRPFHVGVTARAGRSQHELALASIAVNGEPVHAWRLSRAWQTTTCVVPARLVRDGLNHLTIVWPDPGERHEDRVRQVIAGFGSRKLLGGGPSPDVLTIYGEIAVLTARSLVEVADAPALGMRVPDERAAEADGRAAASR